MSGSDGFGGYAVAGGVAHGAANPERQGRHQKNQPKAGPGEQRQLRQLLGNAYLKRIDRAESGPHCGRAQAHGRGRKDRVAQAAHEHQQHRHQRNNFFLHILQRAHGGEKQRNKRNNQRLPPPKARQQPVDAVAQGARYGRPR